VRPRAPRGCGCGCPATQTLAVPRGIRGECTGLQLLSSLEVIPGPPAVLAPAALALLEGSPAHRAWLAALGWGGPPQDPSAGEGHPALQCCHAAVSAWRGGPHGPGGGGAGPRTGCAALSGARTSCCDSSSSQRRARGRRGASASDHRVMSREVSDHSGPRSLRRFESPKQLQRSRMFSGLASSAARRLTSSSLRRSIVSKSIDVRISKSH